MRVGRERLKKILTIIGEMCPEAHGEPGWETSFQLLIAVILSAQTTDKVINKITPNLRKKYPEIANLANANLEDVEDCLRTVSLYKNKARNTVKTARVILRDLDGKVPKTHKELESLPGVGRKTANVVLAEVYGVPSIAVDTRVSRIIKRLNISIPDADVTETEQDSMKKTLKKDWILTHHRLIFFERYHCLAKKPKCDICPVQSYCKYYKDNVKNNQAVLFELLFDIIEVSDILEGKFMQTVLSQCLAAMAELVLQEVRLLDVGSDHAYLPIVLTEEEEISFTIAGEVVKGPYELALHNVAGAGLADKITVRLADGLAAFDESDNVTAITICDMGGGLIVDILAAGVDKLAGVERLILQPNNREDELRIWFMANHFKITVEEIMTENDRFYKIIVVEHEEMTLSDTELRFGLFLNQEKSATFKLRWKRELKRLEIALPHVPKNRIDNRAAISQRIAAIKKAINENK